MADVRIEHLRVEFGDVAAVDDLSLSVADGEFLTLLGPSGCGKTTTLRCIAGLERPTAGEIRIGGARVTETPPAQRDVAMVFQQYALYPHLSVYENIAFPLRTQRLPRAETDERVRVAARTLEIEPLLERRPRQLSGGEQQRVALARAVVRRPRVFLLDEPLTALDPRLRLEARVALKRLQRRLGATMVYVTHDQREALSMAQRIAVMSGGALQQLGTPLEVYNRPATLFVASFIGTPPMNLIECALHDGDAPTLRDGAGRFAYPLPPPQHAQLSRRPGGGRLIYGIRPEDVGLEPGAEGGGARYRVRARELLGDQALYDLEVGLQVFRAKTPPDLRFEVGEAVRIRLDPARSHVFATDTGLAIF